MTQLVTTAVVFLAAGLIAVPVTLLVERLARARKLVDAGDGFRKTHGRPVPAMGGVAIYIAVLLPLLALAAAEMSGALPARLLPVDGRAMLDLAGACTAILLLGLYDDLFGARPLVKAGLQVMVGVAMFMAGFQIQSIANPFGPTLVLGAMALPVTLFWFVGAANAFNLIDGLDGLAAGTALVVTGALLAIGALHGNLLLVLPCAALAGALLGFLWFNFNPARIFLGDAGSMFLGFTLGALALEGAAKGEALVALFVPIVAMGVPITDTALAIVRRWARKLPISAGDRGHLHHRLIDLGLSHRQAVVTLYCCSVLLAGGAVLLSLLDRPGAVVLLIGLAALVGLGLRLLGVRDFSLARQRIVGDLAAWRRGSANRHAVHVAVTRLRNARDLSAVWDCITQALETLDLDRATLELGPGPWADNGHGRRHRWAHPEADAVAPSAGLLWVGNLPLGEPDAPAGKLHVEKNSARNPMAPETIELLEELRTAAGDWLIDRQRAAEAEQRERAATPTSDRAAHEPAASARPEEPPQPAPDAPHEPVNDRSGVPIEPGRENGAPDEKTPAAATDRTERSGRPCEPGEQTDARAEEEPASHAHRGSRAAR